MNKETYEKLKLQHEKACRENNYSKMIMTGDENDINMRLYEQDNVCKHIRIEEIQGGQIERCLDCGKEWG